MARVPLLQKSDLAPGNQDLLDRDITLYKVLAHSPDGARAFKGLGQFIRFKSKLDPRLRELAILQVGWLARAPYEWSHHVKIGHDFGVTDDDIRALIDDTAGKPTRLGPLDKLVLKAAREITKDGAVGATTFGHLEEHLDHERLTDLVVTMAFYNAVVRFLASMEVDVEPEYQKYLDQFPLPK